MKQKKHLFYTDHQNITCKLEVQLDRNTLLVMQTSQKDQLRHSFRLGYYYYSNRAGGAYVLDPDYHQTYLYSPFTNYTVHKGALLTLV